MLKRQRKKTVNKNEIRRQGRNFSNDDELLWVIDFRVAARVFGLQPVVTTAAVLSVGAAKTWSDCRVPIQEASKQAQKFSGCVQFK